MSLYVTGCPGILNLTSIAMCGFAGRFRLVRRVSSHVRELSETHSKGLMMGVRVKQVPPDCHWPGCGIAARLL
jgi:hypothetical protein